PGRVAGDDTSPALALRGGLFRDVAVEVVDQDLGALLRKLLSHCAPDAARRAGHDCRLSVEYSHHLLLSLEFEREMMANRRRKRSGQAAAEPHLRHAPTSTARRRGCAAASSRACGS